MELTQEEQEYMANDVKAIKEAYYTMFTQRHNELMVCKCREKISKLLHQLLFNITK